MPFDNAPIPTEQLLASVSTLDMWLGRGTSARIRKEWKEEEAARQANRLAEWEANDSMDAAYGMFAND